MLGCDWRAGRGGAEAEDSSCAGSWAPSWLAVGFAALQPGVEQCGGELGRAGSGAWGTTERPWGRSSPFGLKPGAGVLG